MPAESNIFSTKGTFSDFDLFASTTDYYEGSALVASGSPPVVASVYLFPYPGCYLILIACLSN